MPRAHRLRLPLPRPRPPQRRATAPGSIPVHLASTGLRAAAPATGGAAAAGRAETMIHGYLRELAHALTGPAPARAGIVTEISDGLLETVASYQAGGLRDDDAVRAAIAEFGEPQLVADAFRPELGVREARRTALALLISGPLVGMAWLAGAVVSWSSARHEVPWLRFEGPWTWWAVPLVALAIAVSVPSLLLALVSASRLGWRLALPASLPPKAAAVASAAAATADITLLGALSVYALASLGSLPLLPLVPAIAASLTRTCLAARASRRCLSTAAGVR